MAAALKRDIEKPLTRRRGRRVIPMMAAKQSGAAVSGKSPTAIADPFKVPLWLHLLVGLYRGTTLFTGGLLIAVLALYGCTVYVDKSVQAGVQRLEGLRRSQQQLTTANEVLKQHLAEQAEDPGAALELPQPNSLIFLPPAAPEANATPEAATVPAQPLVTQPLGY
ncbi:hypothetical protein [Almyronema epifaneia]|uniref:Cell division protein FtsL n=1 Tax=Almyronema epifaneia S1 TaxID=2991925 RepID=A0ABW6IIT2_9CYAN